jgi:hypothetical protein
LAKDFILVVAKENLGARIYEDHITFAAYYNHGVRSGLQQIAEGRFHFAIVAYGGDQRRMQS